MSDKHYCGECALLLEEDIYGDWYCAMKDLFTEAACGDVACEDFIPKNTTDD